MEKKMSRSAVLFLMVGALLVGCSTLQRFSNAVNNAKQAGRPVVVYEINPFTGAGYSGPVGVYFITTASEPLRSVTFELLPYRHSYAMRRAIKKFTAKGPFVPNHAYRYLAPKPAWPGLKGANACVTLVGMTIKRADGKVFHINEHNIKFYLTSNVATACGQQQRA
jgi:hypothetical protein